MQNISHFRITVLALVSILVFSVSPANADRNNLVTVGGVVLPFPELRIAFPPEPKFSVFLLEKGRFIITIDKRLECTFRNDGWQAAIGVRLATPANDHILNRPISGPNYYTISPLVFVETEGEAGVCNDAARYEIRIRDLEENLLVSRPFSFQITGSKIEGSDDDEDDDDYDD